SRNVSPWFRKAIDDPASNRIDTRYHDNRNHISRRLGRAKCSWKRCDEDVNIRLHEFGDQLGYTCWSSLGAATFDLEILPVDVAMLAHSCPQCFDERSGVGGAAGPGHVTDPRNFGGLRPCRERPRGRPAADQRD